MIDSAILRSDPDRIRESQRRRGEGVAIVDRLIEADKQSREARQRFDELRNEQKVLSKQIGPLQGQLKKADDDAKAGLQSDVDELMARAQDLADRVKAAEIDADEAAAAADLLWREVSNLVDPTSPVGGEEDASLGDFIEDDRAVVPLDAASFEMMKAQISDVLHQLGEREQRVIAMRFGLDGDRARTLEEVGDEFGVTRERIRQIEAKTLAKLRHPSRSDQLRDYLHD